MDDSEAVKIPLTGKRGRDGMHAIVTACDKELVDNIEWGLLGGYAINSEVGTMHQIVMGGRPPEIPKNWVIDHINRIKLDNRRTNLRWVTRSFNSWNCDKKGGSIYRGAIKHRAGWLARFLGHHIGVFPTEREAGWAVARAAVATFGEWAETNDLITRNFTSDEIQKMKEEGYMPKQPRELPTGVCRYKATGKYKATYRQEHLGFFDTVQDAKAVYDKAVKLHKDAEWAAYVSTPITYDDDGDAVIALTGTKGEGKFSKVPERFWHQLTYKHTWQLLREYAWGRWEGKSKSLHYAVWKLLHPEYVPREGFSIDHIVPGRTLDNREENLREASQDIQSRNKTKRGKGLYVGVSYKKDNDTWSGTLKIKGVVHRVPDNKCQHESARLLNALRLKHLGPNAILNVIIENA